VQEKRAAMEALAAEVAAEKCAAERELETQARDRAAAERALADETQRRHEEERAAARSANQRREIEAEARRSAEERRAAELQASELRRAIVRRERELAARANAERAELQSLRLRRSLRWIAGPGLASLAAACAVSIAAFMLWNAIDVTYVPAAPVGGQSTAVQPVPAPAQFTILAAAEDAEPVELRLAVELASLDR
jgi:hypothetical protein